MPLFATTSLTNGYNGPKQNDTSHVINDFISDNLAYEWLKCLLNLSRTLYPELGSLTPNKGALPPKTPTPSGELSLRAPFSNT